MTGWMTLVVSVISALCGGGAGAVLIKAIADRRPRRAEVADRLSESTLKWVQEFQEDAAAARREAAEARHEAAQARREAAEARREMGEVRREAETLARDLRNLRGAIMSPTATLERLRALVGGPDLNGRA